MTRGSAGYGEEWLQVIPSAPQYVPPPPRQEAALALVRAYAPKADDIAIVDTDKVVFVDAGANFYRVLCPNCSAEIPAGWWQPEMSRCEACAFAELHVVTPCCGAETTLNDLAYDWPQGFARWWIRARRPARGHLNRTEREALGDAVGHEIREIWTHL